MAQNPQNYRLNGLHPLAYMGVNPPSPADLTIRPFAPTPTDSQNFQLGSTWLVPTTTPEQYWLLVNLEQGVATWVQLYPSGGGAAATSFPTDAGIATPVAGVLNVLGGANINTSAPGPANTVQIQLNNNVDIPGTLTLSGYGQGVLQVQLGGLIFSSVGTDGQILISDTGGAPAWANITSTDLSVTITNGANTIDLSVTGDGGIITLVADDAGTATGTSVNLFGANVVQTSGNNVDTITTSLTNGTDGQLIIGGGGDPAWASVTSGDGSITITTGANTLDLTVTGGGVNPAASCTFFYYQATTASGVVGGAAPVVYDLGASVALTMSYDNSGGAFYAGDGVGAEASFTAPADGVYFLQMTASAQSNGGVSKLSHCFVSVAGTSAQNYYQLGIGNTYDAFLTTNIFASLVPMTAGDIATFSVYQDASGVAGDILGNGTPLGFPAGLLTWVSGYRIV